MKSLNNYINEAAEFELIKTEYREYGVVTLARRENVKCASLSKEKFVKMIAELAQTLGLQVCVEGIETEEQFRVLDGMNVKMIQGYYFDRPMCQAEFEKKYV